MGKGGRDGLPGTVSRLARVRTGSFERRLMLTRAGMMAGGRMAGSYAAGLFSGADSRDRRKREALSREAHYLAEQLGELKGSVVKIGQVMALYGEHFLPVEVTEALHTLEDRTSALEWSTMRAVLLEEFGERIFTELDIEPEPIGAASLGQVHRARHRQDGRMICLKIQYPGVAEAVDADIDSVATLLRLARMVKVGADFDDWLEEVRNMMHREVDYSLELETTRRFGALLADDERYVVPAVYPEYSSSRVLASAYEPGAALTDASVQQLPQTVRNELGIAALELFLRELFVWAELQTDPNFGNYRIRMEGDQYRLVLLDFGAVQKYPETFIRPVCDMIVASRAHDLEGVIRGAIDLHFMRREWPDHVLQEFAEVCMAVLEPLDPQPRNLPEQALNAQGEYCWGRSELPTRIAKRAARSAFSRDFQIPPREFVFLNRKLVGVYTFIAVLHAEFSGAGVLEPFIHLHREKWEHLS